MLMISTLILSLARLLTFSLAPYTSHYNNNIDIPVLKGTMDQL